MVQFLGWSCYVLTDEGSEHGRTDDRSEPGRLFEYSVQENKEQRQVTCWVPAFERSDEAFILRVACIEALDPWSSLPEDIGFHVQCLMDGIEVAKKVIPMKRGQGYVDGWRPSPFKRRAFYFNHPSVSGSTSFSEIADDSIAERGAITVKLCWVTLLDKPPIIYDSTQELVRSRPPSPCTVGQPDVELLHTVTLGPLSWRHYVPEYEGRWQPSDEAFEPFITFRFQHRSKAHLQTIGIISPPGTPDPGDLPVSQSRKRKFRHGSLDQNDSEDDTAVDSLETQLSALGKTKAPTDVPMKNYEQSEQSPPDPSNWGAMEARRIIPLPARSKRSVNMQPAPSSKSVVVKETAELDPNMETVAERPTPSKRQRHHDP